MSPVVDLASVRCPDFGGLDLAVGTWLYKQTPGGFSDAVQVVSIEGNVGPQSYDLIGGMRPLPRTRVTVRLDGGAGDLRVVEHLDAASLRRFVVGNYREHYGYLAAVFTDAEHRAAYVARCQEEPARRVEAARAIEEEKERARVEVGPWFADLEDAIGPRDGSYASVSDVVEAKVLRRALRELAGVKARVTVRRYSMASGLSLAPGAGSEWSERDAQAIARMFPGLAWETTRYDRETGENVTYTRVSDDAHPHKREDRSDLQSDYHDHGGFRVAPVYLLAVSAILSEEIEKATRTP